MKAVPRIRPLLPRTVLWSSWRSGENGGSEPTINLEDALRETTTYYHDHYVGKQETGAAEVEREIA